MHQNLSFRHLYQLLLAALCACLVTLGATSHLPILVEPLQAQSDTDTSEDQTQTATDSSTPAIEEEATQNLKERIERVVQDKQTEIDTTIDELSKQERGFVGQITRLSEESVTIRNPKGSQIISLTDEVQLLKGRAPASIDTIAVDDWATVLGFQNEDTFEPRIVTISTKTLRPPEYSLNIGSIQNITSNKIEVSPRSSEIPETTLGFELEESTQYQDLNGTTINRTDLTEDMQVLILSYQSEDKESISTIIRALTVFETEADEDDSEQTTD